MLRITETGIERVIFCIYWTESKGMRILRVLNFIWKWIHSWTNKKSGSAISSLLSSC